MKRSPLFSGFIYLLLGVLFTYYAIDQVQTNGWGIYSVLLVILATFDFGSGLRTILVNLKYKNKVKR